MIESIYIMWIAVVGYGAGSLGIAMKWILHKKNKIKFNTFPKLLFAFGFILFIVSILYFSQISKIVLHYLFAIGSIIYFYAVALELRKGHNGKS